jgi:malate dehydrogenase
MQRVAILGAGELGGALARSVAATERVSHVILVDPARNVAAGKALDIYQAGPVEGFDTRVTGTDDLASAGQVGIVAVADQHGGGEWTGDAALQLVRRALEVSPRAVVVATGARQRDLLAICARELPVSSSRLIGSAPLAAHAAARVLTALELDCSALDVSLTLVGTPPGWTIGWAEATLGGTALATLLTPPQIARIEARLRAAWPAGPYALASAATAVISSVATGAHRRFTCFVAGDKRGAPPHFVALPATLGARGVVAVHAATLGARERVAVEYAD